MFAVADERRDARLAVCGDGRQLSRRRRIRACSRAARIAADAACGWRLVGSRHSDDPGQDDRDCRTRSMHRNSGKEGNRGTAAQARVRHRRHLSAAVHGLRDRALPQDREHLDADPAALAGGSRASQLDGVRSRRWVDGRHSADCGGGGEGCAGANAIESAHLALHGGGSDRRICERRPRLRHSAGVQADSGDPAHVLAASGPDCGGVAGR
mmetsp:Transcript_36344/g.115771  ORF Transcript_36344/g.115771 Transcript_36344/m.115771 type:complete len:211 (+) Transcript_36344:1214-1846(+)